MQGSARFSGSTFCVEFLSNLECVWVDLDHRVYIGSTLIDRVNAFQI